MKWRVFPNPDGSWHIFKDGEPLSATIETAELIASAPVLDEFARSIAAGQLDLIEARSPAQRIYTTPHRKETILPELTKTCYRKLCLLYTSPSPRDRTRSRMPSSA